MQGVEGGELGAVGRTVKSIAGPGTMDDDGGHGER